MDPVTGLTRRQQVALALLIPLGIAASTVATVISENRQACPDERNGCSTSMAGEPIVIGVLADSAAGPLLTRAVEGKSSILGRRLEADVSDPRCSIRTTAEQARDLADDPPDYPPAAVVISDLCDEVAGAAAQVLDDEGVPMVMLGAPPWWQASGLEQDLTTGDPAPSIDDLTSLIHDALREVAIREGDRVVIPLTELRDAMLARGLLKA